MQQLGDDDEDSRSIGVGVEVDGDQPTLDESDVLVRLNRPAPQVAENFRDGAKRDGADNDGDPRVCVGRLCLVRTRELGCRSDVVDASRPRTAAPILHLQAGQSSNPGAASELCAAPSIVNL